MDETLAPVTVTPVLPNIHQRIARVYAGVGTIAATGRHEQQKYNYIPQSAITTRLRELFAEHGIIFEEHFLSFEAQPLPGGKGEMVLVMMRFALINNDDRDDRIVFETWPGRDVDYGNKGLQKAITNAKKTFLINQFLISEYEDDAPPGNGHDRGHEPPAPPRNAPPTSEPPPEPPNDQTTVHPRDGVLQEFKALREAERTCGLTP